MSQPNRRKHSRVKAQGVAANLQTDLGLAFCVVENVSEGGLFVRTQQVLPVGTRVSMTLALPKFKRALKVNGSVVNVVDAATAAQRRVAPGMGIRFEGLRPDDLRRLGELIEELNAQAERNAKTAPTGGTVSREPRSVARAIDRGTAMESEGPTESGWVGPPGPAAAASKPPVSQAGVPPATVGTSSDVALPTPDPARLVLQIRETRSALDELKAQLRAKEQENAELRAEIERLRRMLPTPR